MLMACCPWKIWSGNSSFVTESSQPLHLAGTLVELNFLRLFKTQELAFPDKSNRSFQVFALLTSFLAIDIYLIICQVLSRNNFNNVDAFVSINPWSSVSQMHFIIGLQAFLITYPINKIFSICSHYIIYKCYTCILALIGISNCL